MSGLEEGDDQTVVELRFCLWGKSRLLGVVSARRCHGENCAVACYAASREDFGLKCWYSRTFI